MTVESIDMVLKLWQAEAPFDFAGDFYRIKIEEPQLELGIGELLKPYQQPHPPIGMSVIRGDSMAATMAGQRGYLPISTNLVADTTLTQHWQTYSAGATEAGLPAPARTRWRISRSILVADDEARAWDYALDEKSAFSRAYEYLIAVLSGAKMLHITKHDPEVPDEQVTPEYLIKNLCIIGDVQSCVDQLAGLWETTGGFDTLLMIAHDWDNRPLWEALDGPARQSSGAAIAVGIGNARTLAMTTIRCVFCQLHFNAVPLPSPYMKADYGNVFRKRRHEQNTRI